MKTAKALPPDQTGVFSQGALELMAQAVAEHHRAVIELQSLFARYGAKTSTHVLTAAKPEVNVRELEDTRSFAVINFSEVTVQVGWGGRSASPGMGTPLLAESFLQLPLETNAVILGASTSELEAAGGQGAMVMFIRYRHLMGLAAGPLQGSAGGGGGGAAETASAVTAGSPGIIEAGVASTAVLPANPSRKGLTIQNTGATAVSLGLGHAAVIGHDLVLEPGASWDGLISGRLWRGAVNAIAAAPTSLAVAEV